jgi:hypothetical protein
MTGDPHKLPIVARWRHLAQQQHLVLGGHPMNRHGNITTFAHVVSVLGARGLASDRRSADILMSVPDDIPR